MTQELQGSILRAWFTAKELTALKLPGLPHHLSNINHLITRNNWRRATASDGQPLALKGPRRSGGWRYHVLLLPQSAQAELRARLHRAAAVKMTASQGDGSEQAGTTAPLTRELARTGQKQAPPEKDHARYGRAQILKAWLVFQKDSTCGLGVAQSEFCQLYRARRVAGLEAGVYDRVAPFSPRTLRAWIAVAEREGVDGLLDTRGRPKGRSLIQRAFGGEMVRRIEAWVIKQPFLTARHIRDFVLVEFGEQVEVEDAAGAVTFRPMPCLREFTRYLARFKAEEAGIIAAITNPDHYRNAFAPALGTADEEVTTPNELWEIDASPADALLLEGSNTPGGRWSLYLIVDVATRRKKALLTRTPRTQAALHLVRLALEDWGVPQMIRTDNGSDFISKGARLAFDALGIAHEICDPYSPQQKPFVERGIGTLQRDFMRTQPGFCGHDVKDRKMIEARKAFAARLGERDEKAFCVELDAEQLQARMENWCNRLYANAPHAGLGGKTPNEVAADYRGPIWTAPEPRILALLMSPVPGNDGIRTVGRKGIRVAGGYYWNHVLRVGSRVFVRHDPADDRRIAVFDTRQSEFLGYAISLDGLSPGERQALAREAKRARQPERRAQIKARKNDAALLDTGLYAEKRAEMYEQRAKEKVRDQARAGTVVRLPNPKKTHSTLQIEAAKEALEDPLKADLKPQELTAEQKERRNALVRELEEAQKPAPPPEGPRDRYARALKLEAQLAAGQTLAATDRLWLERYQGSSEYLSRRDLYEAYGLPEDLTARLSG